MSHALRDSAGKVIGACDSLPFDILGRRPWRPRARSAADTAATDIEITIEMADIIPNYRRLK